MKQSVGIVVVVVVVLVAVGIVGVVYAGAKNSEKISDSASSSIVQVNDQNIANADTTSEIPQSVAMSVSPEPCLMVLIGVGGLIYLIGKKHRNRRRSP